MDERIRRYARLAIRAGIHLQQGQELVISSPVECAPFTRLLAAEAFACGAGDVTVHWTDEAVTRLRYDHLPVEAFQTVPGWLRELNNGSARRGAAHLSISAGNPEAMKGVDPKKPSAYIAASHRECKEFYDALDMGRNQWCILSVPTQAWADKVFPGDSRAVERLWDAILKAVRADSEDPVAAWEQHRRSFQRRTAWLNGAGLDRLHFQNGLGTDITVGLPEGYRFTGGGDRTVGGVDFFPNMPTEEIFCTPDKNRVDGVVYSALPLNYQGTLIDRFHLRFQGGVVTEAHAETGGDALNALLETDEGARRLGELALIPKQSPLSEMGILFYNTLFDENAACHFALGKGFPECIENGLTMTPEQLEQKGMNDSATHVDFMFGTGDLCVTGFDKKGNAVPVFRDGGWAE